MPSAILTSIEQICKEKNISTEQVLNALEQALANAYRKDFGEVNQNIRVKFNPSTGSMEIFDVKTVVENLQEEKTTLKKTAAKKTKEKKKEKVEIEEKKFNPRTEITLSDAKKINKKIKIGQEIITPLSPPTAFGRVAAQTAKQVLTQKLREAEKETIYKNFKTKEKTVISGLIQRKERGEIFIDLDGTNGILPYSKQILEENYLPGQKIKVFIEEVKETVRGPKIILSRRSPEIVKEILFSEIPEITNGTVQIKGIVRIAGYRSKIAVFSKEKAVDPVGACIGQRGIRIQTIINELGGEKVDIINYSDDQEKFISNALAPAKASSLSLNKEKKQALVKMKENQISLAVGRGGQNVQLACLLTGWIINIEKEKEEK